MLFERMFHAVAGAGTGGSTYGYFVGGTNGSVVDTVDRITFSTEATAANGTNLSTARQSPSALSDTALYGYVSGGALNSGFTGVTDRITFATSAVAANTISNIAPREDPAGVSDGGSFGYGYCGGGATTSGSATSTTDRITFSTGIREANGTNLSAGRRGCGNLSDAATYGYFVGGDNNSAYVQTVDRVVFSSSAISANAPSALITGTAYFSGTGNSTQGYLGGGYTGASVSTINVMTYSTGATAVNGSGSLSTSRSGVAASGNGLTYGYFAGGNGPVDTSDRVTFSTGAATAHTASKLTQSRSTSEGLSDSFV